MIKQDDMFILAIFVAALLILLLMEPLKAPEAPEINLDGAAEYMGRKLRSLNCNEE